MGKTNTTSKMTDPKVEAKLAEDEAKTVPLHFILALDVSPASKKGVARIMELARPGDYVQIVSVVDHVQFDAPSEGAVSAGAKEDVLNAINPVLEQMKKKGIHAPLKLMEGDAREKILEAAKIYGRRVDYIVMGSRGLSGLKKVFLGSVAEYVASHSPVPVIIAK